MADSAVANPPAVTIVPATPSKGVKIGGEIKLGTPASIPTEPQPAKPGSAKEGLSQRLRQKGGLEPATPPAQPTPPPKANEPANKGVEPPVSPETPEPTETPAAPTTQTPEEKKKISPWKGWDAEKQISGNLREENQTLRQELDAIKRGNFPKTVQDEIAKHEARVKELEDEIRFVNYEKSPEFKTKYQEPYEKAWQRATTELGELTIAVGPDGQQRQVTAQDILDLVNLPLGKARELADSLYGAFADDAMAHRKEIRGLFETRNSALEEGKKNGAEREKQLREQHEKTYGEISGQVKAHWDKANQDALADEKNGAFFKPIEGDEQWNQRLAKGFELVDRAFSENPLDPKLTPEQRAGVVKRHAAVRNRAAAFGPLKYENAKIKAENLALKKELEQFKGSEPTTGGVRPQPNGAAASGKPWDHIRSGLQKIAAK